MLSLESLDARVRALEAAAASRDTPAPDDELAAVNAQLMASFGVSINPDGSLSHGGRRGPPSPSKSTPHESRVLCACPPPALPAALPPAVGFWAPAQPELSLRPSFPLMCTEAGKGLS